MSNNSILNLTLDSNPTLSNIGTVSMDFTANGKNYHDITITTDGIKYGNDWAYREPTKTVTIVARGYNSGASVYESDSQIPTDVNKIGEFTAGHTNDYTTTKRYLIIAGYASYEDLKSESSGDVQLIVDREYYGDFWPYVAYEILGDGTITFPNMTCFAAGTEIYLGDNKWSAIEKLNVGDNVYSYNTSTGLYQLDTIGEFHIQNGCSSLIIIQFDNGEELKVTKQHSLWTSSGWKCYEPNEHTLTAAALKIGDKVLTMNSELTVVGFKEDNEIQPVYHIVLVNGDTLIVNEKSQLLAEHYQHIDYEEIVRAMAKGPDGDGPSFPSPEREKPEYGGQGGW